MQLWISAARPRTLFLAIATVMMGSGLAGYVDMFRLSVFVLALILAISIQVLANFANDLGDYDKGTDTTGKREGPVRAMQSGGISKRQMLRAIWITTLFTAIIGSSLVISNLRSTTDIAVMISIGALCILAALFYTMGKNAYGYKGWGDLFAFLFFGPVPVIGTYYLHTHTLDLFPVLPAIGLGLVSTMILNINNMRDIDNDKSSGKMTVAVRLGLRNAKFYHTLLTFALFACFIGFNYFYANSPWYRYLYAVVFGLQYFILIKIRSRKDRELDPYLKQTAISGFILSILFVICLNV